MLNLNYKYETRVNNTFIIRMENNSISMNLAERCARSCELQGQEYEFFPAVDWTGINLIIPEFHSSLNLLKLTNTSLTNGEIGCFLSHFLLWVKCVELDAPIVILEHDAILVKPYKIHPYFNIISYLGCIEQYKGWTPQIPLPPHGQYNRNYRFMLRGHAYAIDTMIARRLVAKAINYGIISSADVFIRCDEFSIIQNGFYAYNDPGETTIVGRTDDVDYSKVVCD